MVQPDDIAAKRRTTKDERKEEHEVSDFLESSADYLSKIKRNAKNGRCPEVETKKFKLAISRLS